MGQLVNMCGGAVFLAAASQFPEYSQQYVQRLGGAVDELRLVVADFDKSAAGVGLSRDAALASMTGNDFQRARRADMTRSFARLDRLEGDLVALKGATALQRVTMAGRFRDAMIAERAWQDFKPAVPLTFDGLVFAGGGFLAGFGLMFGIGAGLRRIFRRRKQNVVRQEPPVTRPEQKPIVALRRVGAEE